MWFLGKKWALFSFIRCGDLTKVREVLADGADPNATNSDKETPLMVAIKEGRIEIVRELIRAKADVNLVSKDPFSEAVAGFHPGVMHLVAVHEWTPLQKAAQGGNTEIVNALLQGGADVNRKAGPKTALSVAAGKGRAEIVNALLKAGADVNESKIELSPLASAAAGGHREILQVLLQAGADLHLVNFLGWTALIALSSAALGNAPGVQILLAAGADPDKKDNDGRTAIKIAASAKRAYGVDTELMFALVEGGANLDEATSQPDPVDLNAQDRRGNTTLIVAASVGSKIAVERLLAKKVDVNKKNLEGNSAMKLAQASGHQEIVAMLQQAGASA